MIFPFQVLVDKIINFMLLSLRGKSYRKRSYIWYANVVWKRYPMDGHTEKVIWWKRMRLGVMAVSNAVQAWGILSSWIRMISGCWRIFRRNEADVWTAPCNRKCGAEYRGWIDSAKSQYERTGSLCLSWCRWAVPDSWCATGNLPVIPAWRVYDEKETSLISCRQANVLRRTLRRSRWKSGPACDAQRRTGNLSQHGMLWFVQLDRRW